MSLDRHTCFDVFGDVSTCVVGTIGVVNGNQYVDFPSREVVLFYKASVDGAACTAAIQEPFGAQRFCSCDRVQNDVDKEIVLRAFLAVNNDRRVTELIESFPSIFSSEA